MMSEQASRVGGEEARRGEHLHDETNARPRDALMPLMAPDGPIQIIFETM